MAVNGEQPSTSQLQKNPPPPRPSITLPPRVPMEGLFNGGSGNTAFGFSPGPMTLVSSFFSDSEECKSFSQLLAGAMSSPAGDAGPSGGGSGFKQQPPPQLSPMFMVPHGLSPGGLLDSPGLFSPGQGPFGITHQQALAQVTAQARPHMNISSGYTSSFPAPSITSMAQVPSFITTTTGDLHITPLLPDSRVTMKESSEYSRSDRMSQPSAVAVDKPADDGYNWRKYGQKHVKDSEFPRSYYKCTYPNCPVKKKVERSLDGQITEIIYKGRHNHQPPQPSKRAKDSGLLNGNSSNQGHHDQGGILSKMSKQDHESSQATTEHLSGTIDSEDAGDAETGVDQNDQDEPDAKRRNVGASVSESTSSQRTITEPRIIVQTTSEVDLLDDGYRWRKYGQKVVKGNPYPRSYYKCTTQGCNVRKHVERCSTDPKDVMTTYEGRHNHDVPAARSSSHSIASNAASQLKSQNTSTEKLASMNEIYLRSNNHEEVSRLRLKEEKIT